MTSAAQRPHNVRALSFHCERLALLRPADAVPLLCELHELDGDRALRRSLHLRRGLKFAEPLQPREEFLPGRAAGSVILERSGEAAIGGRGRSLVATQAAGSVGINLASLSRDAVGGGGQGIEGVEVGKATSSIGGVAGQGRPRSGGPGPGRTDEEIQIVFDRHKAALYRLYNRELRRDPTLQGMMVLRITIEPDGSVSLCEVRSSDMDAPKLSAQVAARVKNFDFGAKGKVPAITFLYPIDFLPAT